MIYFEASMKLNKLLNIAKHVDPVVLHNSKD